MDKRKELFIAALKDNIDEVKRAAADSLEKLEVRERLDLLASKIGSGEMLEKIRAVYALNDLRGQAVTDLVTKAAKDPSEDVRAAAARVLGNSTDSGVLKCLVEMLDDQSPVVARAAVEALSRFRDQRLLGPLMKSLKHKDSGVIERAIEAVGRYGDKRCEEAMLYFAAKGNGRMRELALKALGEMDA